MTQPQPQLSPRRDHQILREHRQLLRLTTKLRRTFDTVERLQAKIASLLLRSGS